MRRLLKRMTACIARNDLVWRILNKTVVAFSNAAKAERREAIRDERNSGIHSVSGPSVNVEEEASLVFPEMTVMHGPFMGMKYPEARSVGSSLFPKILGSYERELHPVFDEICLKDYRSIVDIGCAEGYYAVGLAMRMPDTHVFAYDTNVEARALCERMAGVNGVGERVSTGDFCCAETIRSLPLSGRCLVISDCEGYEKKLFSEEVVTILAECEVLVEVRDFVDIEISSVLRERFERTHAITVVRSTDDIAKAQSCEYEELTAYCLSDRRELLAECRPSIMEWFYMVPQPSVA
jgi:hypothetical protein